MILRDACKRLYLDYDYIIRPVSKFLLAFVSLILLQGRLGYMEVLSRVGVILISSILSMFLPYGFISFLCAVFLAGDMFSVSYAMAGFASCVLLLILVLYFGFGPGTGILMTIIPLMFVFKIPYVIPLLLGMSMGLSSIIPVILGVFVYYIVRFFSDNVSLLLNSGGGTEGLIESFLSIARSILGDRHMYVIMAGFALCIIVVYLICHTQIDHAWSIATASGSLCLLIVVILADLRFGGTILTDVLSLIISFGIAILYEVIFYNVDYKRTERLEFEDDDYIYFVKAVPKLKAEDEGLRRE